MLRNFEGFICADLSFILALLTCLSFELLLDMLSPRLNLGEYELLWNLLIVIIGSLKLLDLFPLFVKD